MAKRTAVLYQVHANCMAQHLTGHWHCSRGLLCDLCEATHTNMQRKLTIAWCPDHGVRTSRAGGHDFRGSPAWQGWPL
jgi:hypothetical protein